MSRYSENERTRACRVSAGPGQGDAHVEGSAEDAATSPDTDGMMILSCCCCCGSSLLCQNHHDLLCHQLSWGLGVLSFIGIKKGYVEY